MPPRFLILAAIFLLHFTGFGQQEFHGMISYRSGDTGFLALRANCYFAPGRVRVEVAYPKLPGDEHAYAPFELFDQVTRTVYIAEPRSRILQKISMDTQWTTSYQSKKRLAETKRILGYTCYGIETVSARPPGPDGQKSFWIRSVGWYADKLPTTFHTPYPLALHGITENGHICLMMETTLFAGQDTSVSEIDFVAEQVVAGMPEASLFLPPSGYQTIEFKASELFRKKEDSSLPGRYGRDNNTKN